MSQRDACVQPLPAGVSACGLVMSHREVERVGCDEQIACAVDVRVHARSAVVFLRVDHRAARRFSSI